ncbi:tubulin epsilon and delta complex protein 1 [Talpa occidentalis]|uniref:tubulin epsilon and delta complex protein 1 n=1 Tax=Talpa occidentalis TaxID=50954 RepID=UPI00188E7A1F|nr:tubulin epsilon and delta complex protein 1 [Talpa occidentalis]
MGRRRRRADRAEGAAGLPEAIAALSRTLPDGPSPETFRRAKFDRPEAAPALWRLLLRLLSPPPAAGAAAAPEAEARLVKAALRRQGYPRRALARLPEDGSQGSRELLLAVAWLLARGPLLQRLLTRTRVRLGDEVPLCQCEALASPGSPAPHADADGPVDARRLQWLTGKLRLRRRALAASQREQCALLSKIHSYTRGCHSDQSLGHLSVAETELLRDPEGGRQLLRRLESENARLEAFLQWRRRELVFWQWMDSVLGASAPEASEPTLLPEIPQRGAGQLDLLCGELQALQAELQGVALPRRAAWEAGVRTGCEGPLCGLRSGERGCVGRPPGFLRDPLGGAAVLLGTLLAPAPSLPCDLWGLAGPAAALSLLPRRFRVRCWRGPPSESQGPRRAGVPGLLPRRGGREPLRRNEAGLSCRVSQVLRGPRSWSLGLGRFLGQRVQTAPPAAGLHSGLWLPGTGPLGAAWPPSHLPPRPAAAGPKGGSLQAAVLSLPPSPGSGSGPGEGGVGLGRPLSLGGRGVPGALTALSPQAAARAPERRASRRVVREAVAQELEALRRAWGQGGAPGLPHGPCRLVRSSTTAPGGLRAAQVIGVLRSRVACLEAELRQLRGCCVQELAGLAGALPGLLWIPPPGRRGPRHGPGGSSGGATPSTQ